MQTSSRTPACSRVVERAGARRWPRRAAGGALALGLLAAAHAVATRRGRSDRRLVADGAMNEPAATDAVGWVGPRAGADERLRAPPSVSAPPPASSVDELPRSLRGTDEDGELIETATGDLLVTRRVLRLFDYYLGAAGEESDDRLRARIVAAIHRRLPHERAAAQALTLLDEYLAYREASRAVPWDDRDPRAELETLRRLRRAYFGDAGERLYGDDERASAAALERYERAGGRSLSRDAGATP
jgi:hypothetical protein